MTSLKLLWQIFVTWSDEFVNSWAGGGGGGGDKWKCPLPPKHTLTHTLKRTRWLSWRLCTIDNNWCNSTIKVLAMPRAVINPGEGILPLLFHRVISLYAVSDSDIYVYERPIHIMSYYNHRHQIRPHIMSCCVLWFSERGRSKRHNTERCLFGGRSRC